MPSTKRGLNADNGGHNAEGNKDQCDYECDCDE